jgi:Nse4 C-terminal
MIEKQLEKAYKANDETSLNYIKFAFHPTSFSKTVENIFHISFLVNNCIASIYLGKNSILYVLAALFESIYLRLKG